MDVTFLILAFFAVMMGAALWANYRISRLQARLQRLRPANALYHDICVLSLSQPSKPASRQSSALLFVSPKRISAYAVRGDDTPLVSILPHEIEGYWRPSKYTDGDNTIEIHANVDGQWTILRVRLARWRMVKLVRALKELVDPEILRAYRQRRPYIYRPPAEAFMASQDLHGMWTLGMDFRLYLMPSRLVFLDGDDLVDTVISLRNIQNIRVLDRLDAPGSGLLAFDLPDCSESIAIAIADTESWAQSIAAAARRTLEEPVHSKRKGKDLEEDWDVDDADGDWADEGFDMALWDSHEYILGDDGELERRQ